MDKALKDAMIQLSQTEGITLFMMLFAAFNVLLSRITGQNDIVVDSPIGERNRKEFENLIGLFCQYFGA